MSCSVIAIAITGQDITQHTHITIAIAITGQDMTQHTLQQACCYINILVNEVKTSIVSP